MSLFPPFLGSAKKDPAVFPYPPDGAATFGPSALVYYDTATNTLKVCGADPALIAGLSLGKATAVFTPDGKVSVLLLDPDVVIGLSSTTTPAQSHVGDEYGITVDATTGYWQLDTAKGGAAARCLVVDVNIPNGVFFVKFKAANIQFGAVAS